MAKKYLLNRKNVNVVIHSWYCLDGEYIRFPDTEIDGTEYSNVDVTIHDTVQNYGVVTVKGQLINITGQEPIFCEYISCYQRDNGKLEINICEDWG